MLTSTKINHLLNMIEYIETLEFYEMEKEEKEMLENIKEDLMQLKTNQSNTIFNPLAITKHNIF